MAANLRELHCEYVSASDDGDYFQVMFELTQDSEEGSLIVQRQFELPDGSEPLVNSQMKMTRMTNGPAIVPASRATGAFRRLPGIIGESCRYRIKGAPLRGQASWIPPLETLPTPPAG
jgi:hypothetical protein